MDAATAATAVAAECRLQVIDRNLRLLVEVYDQRQSCPPCRFTPAGGVDSGCVQVDVITKTRENVEYDLYKGIGATVCLGYHAQGAAVVVPQQAIAVNVLS